METIVLVAVGVTLLLHSSTLTILALQIASLEMQLSRGLLVLPQTKRLDEPDDGAVEATDG